MPSLGHAREQRRAGSEHAAGPDEIDVVIRLEWVGRREPEPTALREVEQAVTCVVADRLRCDPFRAFRRTSASAGCCRVSRCVQIHASAPDTMAAEIARAARDHIARASVRAGHGHLPRRRRGRRCRSHSTGSRTSPWRCAGQSRRRSARADSRQGRERSRSLVSRRSQRRSTSPDGTPPRITSSSIGTSASLPKLRLITPGPALAAAPIPAMIAESPSRLFRPRPTVQPDAGVDAADLPPCAPTSELIAVPEIVGEVILLAVERDGVRSARELGVAQSRPVSTMVTRLRAGAE